MWCSRECVSDSAWLLPFFRLFTNESWVSCMIIAWAYFIFSFCTTVHLLTVVSIWGRLQPAVFWICSTPPLSVCLTCHQYRRLNTDKFTFLLFSFISLFLLSFFSFFFLFFTFLFLFLSLFLASFPFLPSSLPSFLAFYFFISLSISLLYYLLPFFVSSKVASQACFI